MEKGRLCYRIGGPKIETKFPCICLSLTHLFLGLVTTLDLSDEISRVDIDIGIQLKKDTLSFRFRLHHFRTVNISDHILLSEMLVV